MHLAVQVSWMLAQEEGRKIGPFIVLENHHQSRPTGLDRAVYISEINK